MREYDTKENFKNSLPEYLYVIASQDPERLLRALTFNGETWFFKKDVVLGSGLPRAALEWDGLVDSSRERIVTPAWLDDDGTPIVSGKRSSIVIDQFAAERVITHSKSRLAEPFYWWFHDVALAQIKEHKPKYVILCGDAYEKVKQSQKCPSPVGPEDKDTQPAGSVGPGSAQG